MIQGLAELLVLLCELDWPGLPKAHSVDDPSSHQLYFLARRTGKVAGALDLDAFFGRAGHFFGEVSDYAQPGLRVRTPSPAGWPRNPLQRPTGPRMPRPCSRAAWG